MLSCVSATFLQHIPSIRPILLIQDGHTSHTSIELIDLARENNIHQLCLPLHTTHILQPLDAGVFKSFKSNFAKVCTKYMYLAKHPGELLLWASLVGEAWPLSFTSVNVLSGFKKCGIFPLNPREVTDRQLAPFRDATLNPPLFPKEKGELFQKQYKEK